MLVIALCDCAVTPTRRPAAIERNGHACAGPRLARSWWPLDAEHAAIQLQRQATGGIDAGLGLALERPRRRSGEKPWGPPHQQVTTSAPRSLAVDAVFDDPVGDGTERLALRVGLERRGRQEADRVEGESRRASQDVDRARLVVDVHDVAGIATEVFRRMVGIDGALTGPELDLLAWEVIPPDDALLLVPYVSDELEPRRWPRPAR